MTPPCYEDAKALGSTGFRVAPKKSFWGWESAVNTQTDIIRDPRAKDRDAYLNHARCRIRSMVSAHPDREFDAYPVAPSS